MDWEEYLFSLSRFGIKLGLGPTATFSAMLGDPHKSFRSAHITGSNGKGSTTSFIYNIFRRKLKCGIYTSPHLRRFNERIIVDGEQIPSVFIREFVEKHPTKINFYGEEVQLTFFEYTTVMAFDYFRELGVQFASIEVGLGGKLDSTNIVLPEVSVITSISLEHADRLGGSIEDIAREKGGIIKKNRPVVIGKVPDQAKKILVNIAKENNSPIKETENCKISNLSYSLNGTSFHLETEVDGYDVVLKALGMHQVNNSIAAILSAESINFAPKKEDVLKGISETRVPGRFEIRRKKPLFILDGAHNSEATRVLANNVKLYGIKDPLIVLGVLKDKNSFNILQNLSEVSSKIIITEPNEPERRKDASILKKEASLFFNDIEIRERPFEAISEAYNSKEDVIVTGSLYLVGETEKIIDTLENRGSGMEDIYSSSGNETPVE
ncbi:MAG: folylpolyglutamate synthase/dihydrofolate synthase family protein [Thermoplasmatales archaeon]